MIGTVSAPAPDPALADRIRSAVPRDDEGAQAYLRGRAHAWTWCRPCTSSPAASRGAPCTPPGTARGSSPWARIPRPWRDASSPWSRTGACPRGSPWSAGPSPRLPARMRPVEHWEWDWWFTTVRPTRARRRGPGRRALAADDPRIPELLAVASPDAMIRPGDPRIRGWWAIERPDRWAPAPTGRTADRSAPRRRPARGHRRRHVDATRDPAPRIGRHPSRTGAAGGCPGTCAPA